MKSKNQHPFLVAAIALTLTASSAYALTWDLTSGDNPTITDGSGNWNTTAGNLVWNNNANPNVIWSHTSTTLGTQSAVFGSGTDGTVDQWTVTLATQMAATSLTFNNTGYKITGSTLALIPTASTNGAIVVAAGKTATISSALAYANNAPASITVNTGSTLNLGGGASNAQYTFSGAGTVNMTAGTYTANTGVVNVAAFNQTGGTFNITPGNGIGYNINSATQNVAYNLSAGTLTVNGNASTATVNNAFLGIGNGTAANTSTLNVSGTSIVNVGITTSRAGEIRIGNTTASNGTLNVSGGTVTIGTGSAANQIYFFKAGSGAGFTAAMTQSAGTVTTNGIQFGGSTGLTTYNATSSTALTLSGGNLYIGAAGISKGTDATSLTTTIKLQGGTLGANQNWNSALDMKLGTTAGGPTIRAQDAAANARNITLFGILSDDDAVNGTLTKTGSGSLTLANANTFTGATVVNAGTLVLSDADALSSSSSLTIANGAGLSLTNTSSTVKTLTFTNTGSLNFDLAGGGTNLTISTLDGITNSGAAGSIAININGSAPANGTYTLISYNGSLLGSGFSAYTLGNTPAGKSYTLSDTGSAVQLVVTSAYVWTGSQSSEWSTAIIAGSKNWTLDSSPTDYVNDIAVIFDSTAANKTVDITGADVTPKSVLFNSGDYTLQGSNKIAGAAPVIVEAAATLKLGSSNVLPDGVGASNLTINGIFDLNGFSETINGLAGNGSVDNTAASTTSTLTLGTISGGNFSGTIQNSVGILALTKTGATDLILSGTNTYSGATTINQNRLFIASSAAFSPNTAVTVNNGTSFVLSASGTPTFAQSITLNSGANLSLRQVATLSNVTLPPTGSVIFNNDDVATQAASLASPQALSGSLNIQVGGGSGTPGAVTLSGILSGSGSLVKTGSGTLALTGANTFDGGVSIRNGTLESRTTTTTLGTGTVTMGGSGSTGATFITGQNNANPFVINAPTSGNNVIGANGAGSGFTMSGGITLNGNLTLQTFNNTISGATKASTTLTGGVSGTGNLLLNNLGLAANTISITTTAINHTGAITLQGTATGNTTISAGIGSNVTGVTQNSATSIMILSGANTYPGNLTVNAGTVRISNAPSALNANTGNDASTVTIAATGATLDLTYAGTDKVDKLVIGSTQQADGVYGKVGSASPIIGIPQITGDGTLTVGTVTPSGFSSWITGTFANGTVPGDQQGPHDDFDNDGVSNLLEYAIAGQDPTVGNLSISTFNGGTLSFTKASGTSGLTYAIQKSTDLGMTDPWVAVSGGSYVNNASTISFTLTPGTPAKNFLRLQVLSD
jgi:autotransporter-associated beta strand protein